ncbi:MAG: hypothetical protein KGI04_00190 [Candidatus Micrarchaeota archaeon]|nr:hypothetical protein [Candidatus Micrarchaeota archaeon]
MSKLAQPKEHAEKDKEILGYAKLFAERLKAETGMDLTGYGYEVREEPVDGKVLSVGGGRVIISRSMFEEGEELFREDGVRSGLYALGSHLFSAGMTELYPDSTSTFISDYAGVETKAEWMQLTNSYAALFSADCIYEISPVGSNWREHIVEYMDTIIACGVSQLNAVKPGFDEAFDMEHELNEAIRSFRTSGNLVPYLAPRLAELVELDDESQQAYTTVLTGVTSIVLSPNKDALAKNLAAYMGSAVRIAEIHKELTSVRRPESDMMLNPDWSRN